MADASFQRSGLFAQWQPLYAELGLATFPVVEKRPVVRGYMRVGLAVSQQLAIKFPGSNSFGLACRQNHITVLDVDAPDEHLLADIMGELGPSPFVVRSASGNFQAWYRHNGESRRIRPDPSRPIDILGDGFVVAPPSRSSSGCYTIVQGSLESLTQLPTLKMGSVKTVGTAPGADRVATGRRNDALWRECMTRARNCDSLSQLMEVAVSLNTTMFYEPLPDAEVLRIVASAWEKEIAGDNWFGGGGRVIVSAKEVDDLLSNKPDAFALLMILRRHHWGRPFVIANAMADQMPGGGWHRKRLAAARKALEDVGEIKRLRPASKQSGPALYQFKGGQL